MIDYRVLSKAEELKAGGAKVDEIILFLRNNGVNKIGSIRAIRSLYGKSLNDAKALVDFSDAWSDRFHADVIVKNEAIEELLGSIIRDDQNSGQ